MLDQSITRFGSPKSLGGGVSNESDTAFFGDLGVPNRSRYHEYLEDFNTYTTTDWTVTTVTAGSPTQALITNADGGILALTNTTGSTDSTFFDLVANGFVFLTGFRLWYKSIFQISSTAPSVVLGMSSAGNWATSTLAPSLGVYLSIVAGVPTFNIKPSGAAAVSLVPSGVTIAAGAMTNGQMTAPVTVAMYYDGNCYGFAPYGRVLLELSGAGVVGGPWRGEIACPFSATAANSFPNQTLGNPTTPGFGIVNTTGIASILWIDQLYVVKDRANILSTPSF